LRNEALPLFGGSDGSERADPTSKPDLKKKKTGHKAGGEIGIGNEWIRLNLPRELKSKTLRGGVKQHFGNMRK